MGGSRWLLLWTGMILLSSILTFDPKLYINGDNVDYIRLAEAARAGNLWASAKYPPLFPWLLAPVQAIFGVALLPQKILVSLFYAASGILLLLRARRHFPHPWYGPIAWAAMTLVPVLEFGHYVMSEIPYLFFSLVALEALERARPDGRTAWIVAALAGAATFYTRSVGLALWAALAISATARRRNEARRVLLFAGVSLALFLPWGLRAALGQPNPYFRQLIQVNPFHPEWGLLDAGGWIARIATNARVYLAGEIPQHMMPVVFRWTYDPGELRYAYLPWSVAWIPILLLGIGFALSLRRREPLGVYLVLYLIVNLLWPRLWTGLRFLVPILPLLFLVQFRALFHLLGVVGGAMPPRPRIAAALLAVFLLLGVKNQATLAREVGDYPPDWGAYFRAAAWIRDHAPAEARVVDRKAAILSYATGREVVSFPREEDPDRMIAWMRDARVDLVVVPSLPYDDIHRYLIPAVQARQAYFTPLFEVESPYTVVLRFIPEPD